MVTSGNIRTREIISKTAITTTWAAILFCVISYVSGFYITGEMIVKVFGTLEVGFLWQRLDLLMPIVGAVCGVAGAATSGGNRRNVVLGVLGTILCIGLLMVYAWILIVVVGLSDY